MEKHKKRDYRVVWRGLLALALAAFVVLSNIYMTEVSSIHSPAKLRFELAGLQSFETSDSWVEDYFWKQPTPFKYRILGKFPLWAVYQINKSLGIEKEFAIYYSFVICSFIFLFSTLYALGSFVRNIVNQLHQGISTQTSEWLAGTSLVLFTLSPPILLFFKHPVHGTPNDLLGYFLMLIALYSMLKQRIVLFCVVSTVSVFCRETTLLIPFIFLFFYRYPTQGKLVATFVPVAVFILYRVVWPGTYDIFAGWHTNIAIPLETLGFALLIFGPLWILGTLGYFDLKKRETTLNSPFITAMTKSFPWALLLTFSIVSLFASIREMRIAYVLFFYFIPFSVIWLHNNRVLIFNLVKNKYYMLFLVAVITIVFRLWVWFMPTNTEEYFRLASIFGKLYRTEIEMISIGNQFTLLYTPQNSWINNFFIYFFMFLICIPFLRLPLRKNENKEGIGI